MESFPTSPFSRTCQTCRRYVAPVRAVTNRPPPPFEDRTEDRAKKVFVGGLSVAALGRGLRALRPARRRPRALLRALVAPPLEDTLIQVFKDGLETLGLSGDQQLDRPTGWQIEEEDEIADGALFYSRFKIDGIPPRQGGTVGNTLRRTLLRQDLFRTYAPVAFRLRYRSYNVDQGRVYVSTAQTALHEFAAVPGVQESMIDVVKSVQQLTVASAPWKAPKDLPLSAMAGEHSGEPDAWRWATRRCGICSIKALDLDMVDSSVFYEKPAYLPLGDQHLLHVSAPAMIEFEVEATCCSQTEWEISPAFEAYRQRLRYDRWLIVPPLFSPVKKVNYMVTAGEDSDKETVQLEVWTTKAARPAHLVQTSAATLLASLIGRRAEETEDVAKPEALPTAGSAFAAEVDQASARLSDMRSDEDALMEDDGQDALSELLSSASQREAGLEDDEGDEGMRALTEGLFDM